MSDDDVTARTAGTWLVSLAAPGRVRSVMVSGREAFTRDAAIELALDRNGDDDWAVRGVRHTIKTFAHAEARAEETA